MGEAKPAQEALLYHFTFLRYLESIAAEGLKPKGDIVWLTADPRTFYATDRHGRPLPPSHAHDCRITVVIPSDDRRLVRWERVLRKRGGAERIEFFLRNPHLGRERALNTVLDWYCCFGAVPPEYFREIVEVDTCWRDAG